MKKINTKGAGDGEEIKEKRKTETRREKRESRWRILESERREGRKREMRMRDVDCETKDTKDDKRKERK